MQYLRKRFRFEYSSGNNDVYRENWERIFGRNEAEEVQPAGSSEDTGSGADKPEDGKS